MKSKNILYCAILLLSVFLMYSCERNLTSKDISTITYYPDFVYNGDEEMFIELGGIFTEPGVTASEVGVPVDVITSVTSRFQGYSGTEVNTDVADMYTIFYEATNSDGYSVTRERAVNVAVTGDLVNSIEGLYIGSVLRTNNSEEYENIRYILIWETGEDEYEISDALGGFYADGRLYGDLFRNQGTTIVANDIPTNDFTFTPGATPGFAGDPPIEIVSMTVDPVAKTIVMLVNWPIDAETTYNFVITLEQVEL